MQTVHIKLTRMEHDRWRNERMYIYCGNLNHVVASCPVQKGVTKYSDQTERMTISSNTATVSPSQFLAFQSFTLNNQIKHSENACSPSLAELLQSSLTMTPNLSHPAQVLLADTPATSEEEYNRQWLQHSTQQSVPNPLLLQVKYMKNPSTLCKP